MFSKGVHYKGRSSWKGLNLFVFSLDYFSESNLIMKKSYIIGLYEINNNFKIYNGKEYKPFLFNYRSSGCKFGQFVATKKIGKSIHLNEKKKRKKKNG